MLSTLARLLALSFLLLAGVALAQDQPFFVQFKIEQTQGEKGFSTWLATYEEKNEKAAFIIAIQQPTTSTERILFVKGSLRRVPGSQSDSFLKKLFVALGGKGKVPLATRVSTLPIELAVLGSKQSRVNDGGFRSNPPGDWIPMKAFLADGKGEVYLNLNAVEGIGEFSVKDEGYAEVVLREVGSIL